MMIICMLAIFGFSSQDGSSSSKISGSITHKVIAVINPDYDSLSVSAQRAYYKDVHFTVRKLAHFSIFMLLGILALLTFDSYPIRSMAVKVAAAMFLCLLYAATDEIHQMFSDGRSAQLRDVMIDSAGMVTGILLTLPILKMLEKRVKNLQKGL